MAVSPAQTVIHFGLFELDLKAGQLSRNGTPEVGPRSVSVNRYNLVPGKDLSHFAYAKTLAHRNLYRITLP